MADVLTHRAQLPAINLIEAELWEATWADRTRRCFAEWDGPRQAGRVDYSEYSGWFLLAVGSATLGLAWPDGLGPGWMLGRTRSSTFGAYGVGPDPCPFLLHDLLPSFVEARPAVLGGHASAAGLAQWYAQFLPPAQRDLVGGHVPDSAPMHTFYSLAFLRSTSFVNGFMADIGSFLGVESLSKEAYGHVGWNGAAFGCVDPMLGISLGLILNTTDVGHDRFFRARAAVVEAAVEAAVP